MNYYFNPARRRRIIMRANLVFTFMLFAIMQVAASGFAQITINKKNVSLPDVFQEIRKQSGYDFFYNEDLIEKAELVNIRLNNASIEEALESCLSNQDLSYTIKDNIVIIKEKISLLPQQITVKGRVTDLGGVVLPGVSIMIKGTKTVVITNDRGEFSINVPKAGSILVFSFIGMKKKEITVASVNTTINVVLEVEEAVIEDVVVTGIFNRSESTFTGSATTIGREDLLKVSNKSLIQSLKVLEPSLMMFDNLDIGSDPNKLPEIRLRGTSSFPIEEGVDLSAASLNDPNQPLFILDGFETTLVKVIDLDMDRIETVTILKDASAKALYGSKAANGVIVIETKKLMGGKVGVSYSSSTDIETPDLSSYNLMNSAEKLEAERIYGLYSLNHSYTPNFLTQLELDQQYTARLKTVLSGVDTDWMSKPLRNGIGQKHSLAIQLGESNLKVNANFSYNQITGVMKGSRRNTLSSSVSMAYRYKKFLFRNILTVTGNKSNDSPYGTFGDFSKMNPYSTPYDEFGILKTNAETGIIPYSGTTEIGNFFAPNPLFNSTLNTRLTNDYTDITDNLYTEFFVLAGLRSTLRVGLTKTSKQSDQFYPANHLTFTGYQGDDFFRRGSYARMEGTQNGLSGDFNVNYSKVFGNNHSVFANVGANMAEKSYENVNYSAEGFPNDRMTNILFANQYSKYSNRPRGNEGTTRDLGLLSVVSYSYNNRLLLDASYRTSASSQFGVNSRWGAFWSTGLGWNLHEENFIKNLNIFDRLKIRGSVGSTGSQNFSSYQSISTYRYSLDRVYQGYLGAQLIGLANDDLKWQQKMDYNAGLDFTFKRKFIVRMDYYQSITENTLIDFSLPPSTGFSSVKENLGKIKNVGIEGMFTYNILSKPRTKSYLSLTTSGIYNKNKVLEISDALRTYNEEQDKRSNDVFNNRPVIKYYDGMSMTSIWAVRSLGIDPANGREIYINRDGDMTYTYSASDQVVVGDRTPKLSGTFGVTAGHKGFAVNLFFRYLVGGQIYNQTLIDRVENVNMSYNVDRRVLNSTWQKPGDVKPFKALGSVQVQNEDGSWERKFLRTQPSDRFVMERDELRLATLNLSYDLTKNGIVKRIGAERIRFGFYTNDVFLLSSVQTERGLSYPFSRKFSFSLQVQF